MEYRSNISISSNIYTCNHDQPEQDADFVQNCRGYSGLIALDKRIKRLGTLTAIRLTDLQRYELENGRPCQSKVNSPIGQKTHGLVRSEGKVKRVCRCENTQCENFSKHMPIPIKREWDMLPPEENQTLTEVHYEWLGVNANDDVFDEPEVDIEEEPAPEAVSEAPVVIPSNYTKLTDASVIIKADVNSHILVNAGSGTGKTHTTAERLVYLIHSGDVEDLSQIWVLCYTNATRDAILQKLTEKGLGEKARQLVICTIDSLAWQYLAEECQEEADINSLFDLGYSGCINQFTKMLSAETYNGELEGVKYIIIDELQDIVNERARMVLNILRVVKCGYLLLGDSCQSIYNYDCDDVDSIDSAKFYNVINKLMPKTGLRYELIGNNRQSLALSGDSIRLREALLNLDADDANNFCRDQINKMPKIRFAASRLEELINPGTTAILTRTGGEAEWLSAKFHEKGLKHTLLRTTSPQLSLSRWLADMFWDYRKPKISKTDFLERFMIRVKNNQESATLAYHALTESLEDSNNHASYIELKELSHSLKLGKHVHPALQNKPYEGLTVSTVHKAKGREFDHVHMLHSEFAPQPGNTGEARTWYVGATRPKLTFNCLKRPKWTMRKAETGRWTWTGTTRKKWDRESTAYCSNIVIGLPGDVEPRGFVEGDLESSVKRQAYIARNIKVKDKVDIRLQDGTYQIYHDGICIGALSHGMVEELSDSINSLHNSKDAPPPRFSDIYVKNIVTIVPLSFPNEADSLFKNAPFWLGVELTGFAKIH